MLNAHPKLCAGPEFKLTPLIADLYNQTIGRKDILSAYSLDENDINRQYASFIGAFFEKFRMQNNADRVIEKTPHNVLIMKELGSIYPEAKFIHVVRDGRDVACSLNKMAGLTPMANLCGMFKMWRAQLLIGYKLLRKD